MRPDAEPIVIGWTEYVDLPEWGVRGLLAKADTGARSSALHVEEIRELPGGRVSFYVVVHRDHRDRWIRVKARVLRRGEVRSSTGHSSRRLFVSTSLRLGSLERKIELSLVDRERMRHRMLLGRTALTGAVLIDAGRRNRLGRPGRRKTKKHADTLARKA